MSLQQRTAVTSLTQSLYSVMQGMGFSETKMDEIQDHLDSIVAVSNDKTKNATLDTIDSVDVERKQRRKDKKDGKKDKDKTKPVQASRKVTKKSSD